MSPQPTLPPFAAPIPVEAVPLAELVDPMKLTELVWLVRLPDIVADVAIAWDVVL